jgi:hypothetical protein
MEYDVYGQNDEHQARVKRSLEAITKDFKHAVFSDGTVLPVKFYDDNDEVEDIDDAVYVGGGNDEIGYFTVALAPLRHMVFH